MQIVKNNKKLIVLAAAVVAIVAGLCFAQSAIAADSPVAKVHKTLSNGVTVVVTNNDGCEKITIEETTTQANNTVGTPCANFRVQCNRQDDHLCTVTIIAPNAAYAAGKTGHIYVQHEASSQPSQDFPVTFDGAGSATINSHLSYFSVVADIVAPGGTNSSTTSPQTGIS